MDIAETEIDGYCKNRRTYNVYLTETENVENCKTEGQIMCV